MKVDYIYDAFLDAIKTKIPQEKNIANTLMDILHIGKEAIYRRLREEVPFTFEEIAKISLALELSLDNIIGAASTKKRPFQLRLADHLNPLKIDLEIINQYVKMLELMSHDPHSEAGCTTNTIPNVFTSKYPTLNKYSLFKWAYFYNEQKTVPRLREIEITEDTRKLQKDFRDMSAFIGHTFYVFDHLAFKYFANDIKFFSSINMITAKEVEQLKEETLLVIDDLETLCINGGFHNNKKVQLYISDMNFETGYSYFYSEMYDIEISIINVFILNSIASTDKNTFDKTHHWIKAQKRCATLISESGEIERINFFSEQRRIINTI